MNAAIYYSNTGESKRIADFFAEYLNFEITAITEAESHYENAVLIFPVHCQNVPQAVKLFLRNLTVENLTVIATYGKMCHGNVLYEIQQKYKHNIVAAAYVPAKHAYLDEPRFCNFEELRKVAAKTANPLPIKIPKSYKNPLASVFTGLRSRIGVKIFKNNNCDNCGICQNNCIHHAIVSGKINRKCIRCLNCVHNCPQKALTFKTAYLMKAYLKKKKQNELIIYV